MEQELFRKETLAKISSPEDLKKTINITSPSVWIFSMAVLLFLVALLIWGMRTTIHTTRNVLVAGDTVFLKEADIAGVNPGSEVRSGDLTAAVVAIPEEPVCAQDVLTKYQMHVQGLGPDDWVYCLPIAPAAPEGVKDAEIVVETIHPIVFFWN